MTTEWTTEDGRRLTDVLRETADARTFYPCHGDWADQGMCYGGQILTHWDKWTQLLALFLILVFLAFWQWNRRSYRKKRAEEDKALTNGKGEINAESIRRLHQRLNDVDKRIAVLEYRADEAGDALRSPVKEKSL